MIQRMDFGDLIPLNHDIAINIAFAGDTLAKDAFCHNLLRSWHSAVVAVPNYEVADFVFMQPDISISELHLHISNMPAKWALSLGMKGVVNAQ